MAEGQDVLFSAIFVLKKGCCIKFSEQFFSVQKENLSHDKEKMI